jgi:soluble lytic murein transglycosylase-like protein
MEEYWTVDEFEEAEEIETYVFPLGFLLPPAAALLVGFFLAVLLGSLLPLPVLLSAASATEAHAAEISSAQSSETNTIAPLFTPEIQYWQADIVRWAQRFELDPNLVATVMQIESCGNPQAVSTSGAAGLFQVMPFHFASGDDCFDPDTNAKRGLAYLKRSLQTANGDPRLALAGYNGGISRITVPESNWAAETQRYAYWGSGIYADAARGLSQSDRLDEWLSRASGMCATARQKLELSD